ncbi:MAG: nitroreductase [Alphaproteobacteria bacterium]|nr:nitroreductase [Alphaproteobacteria bacterium]
MTRLTSKSPSVSDALNTRFSCRAFLDKPVPSADINAIIETAIRTPSGGNLQPWHVWAVQGAPLKSFVDDIQKKLPNAPVGEGAEYEIYPPKLKDPYRTRRDSLGAALYDSIGIARADKIGRMQQFANNFRFFNAPCALFFAVDKNMQEGQWSDTGMLIQSMMLLARERGLHTCPQEAWAIWSPSVKKFLDIPDTMTFFCALAIGYADTDAKINAFESPRAPLNEIVKYVGF